MALTPYEVTDIHDSMRSVAEHFFASTLDGPSTTFYAKCELHSQLLELNALRNLGVKSFEAATFQYEISESFDAVNMPGYTSYWTRSYNMTPHTVVRSLYVYRSVGACTIGERVHANNILFKGKNMSVQEANAYRHINAGLLDYDEITRDIELARIVMGNITIEHLAMLALQSQEDEDLE